MTLGERIKSCRLAKGFTQKNVADVVGVTSKTISFYEHDDRMPPLDIIAKLTKLFDVSADYLMGLTDSQTHAPSDIEDSAMPAAKLPRKNYLSYWIGKSGIKRSEITQKLGITKETLEDYCSGRLYPSQDFLEQLSALCKLPADRFLCETEHDFETGEESYPYKFDPEISRRMKQTFVSNDHTYKTLASALGVSEKEVYNFIEYGFVPHVDILIKFAKMFSVSADYLLNLSDIKARFVLPDEEFSLAAQQLNSLNRFIAYGEILKLVKEQVRDEAAKDEILENDLFKDESSNSKPEEEVLFERKPDDESIENEQ